MADPLNLTPARANLTPKIWTRDFFTEYVRANPFSIYMGKGDYNLIQVNEDLTKKPGDRVVFASAHRLKGAGVRGNQVLRGNEELLDLRSMEIAIEYFRHAVAFSKWDSQKSVIELLEVARDGLRTWALEKMRDDILIALTNIPGALNAPVPYATATAAQRNAWLVNNSDRVLYGNSIANAASGVAATALATVNNTYSTATTPGGRISGRTVSTAKRMAATASPRIRPVQVKNKRNGTAQEWHVLFLNSWQFRDFRSDPDVQLAQRDALERGEDNPIFAGGDLIWDRTIVREVPEMSPFTINGAGAGGINVAAGYLCGAQALGIAWAQRSEAIDDSYDYKKDRGVGVDEMRGIDKLRFGKDPADDLGQPVDHGMITMFNASVADG